MRKFRKIILALSKKNVIFGALFLCIVLYIGDDEKDDFCFSGTLRCGMQMYAQEVVEASNGKRWMCVLPLYS